VQVKRQQYAVIGLAVFLALFVWYKMVYSSMENSASKAKQAEQDASASVTQLQHQLASLTGGKSAKARKASLEEVQAAIPAKIAMSDFLRDIQLIRNEVGIPAPFQSVVPQPPTLFGNVASINFGITVTGSYQQMRDYINRLVAMPRLVVVDNVSVVAGAAEGVSSNGPPTGEIFAGQGAPPRLTVQMTARMFAQAPVAATVGGTTPGGAARPAGSTTNN
jgi:Tfp pilus assembly protein PilO